MFKFVVFVAVFSLNLYIRVIFKFGYVMYLCDGGSIVIQYILLFPKLKSDNVDNSK